MRVEFAVQLPPAVYAKRALLDESSLSVFLEAQRQSLAIPYTSMAVASDLGMANGLHQPQKYELAIRLAHLAFANVYDFSDAIAAGPQYKSMRSEDGKITLTFETFGSTLVTRDGQPPRFFEIRAKGREFQPGQTKLEGNRVVVWSDDVEKPYDVRMAFKETELMDINLTNAEGVPAAVFWARANRQLHPELLGSSQ